MARERFKRQGKGTFFGEMIYERIVPKDHFLRKLDELIPWERFTKRLVKLYRGKGRSGRPPYDPAVVLKMLLVAYLYDLSERQVEAVANDSLSVKYFLGLAADEPAPDHSTLTAFKRRLVDNGGGSVFEQLLVEIVVIAQERGIEFGAIQVMDSVHTEADVNTGKDQGRQDRGQGPRDGGARWGVKHKRRVKDEKGHTRKVPKYFYGYKAHVSLNADTEMITSLVVTPGNAYDGHELPELLEKDLAAGIPIEIVAADRGYDDSENHYLLELKGLNSAICLNDYRTKKKDKNKQVWIDLKGSPEYRAGQRERYKVERKFGEAKQNHGLRRCRYVGYIRYLIQACLTAIVLNLKRMVKLLTGVPFKGTARASA